MGWTVKESLERKNLWTVLDSLDLPSFAVTPDFRITDQNASAARHLSFTRKDLEGRSLMDILRLPAFQPGVFASRGSVSLEGQCFRKDRESFPARVTFARVPEGFVVVVENRSEMEGLARRAAQRSKEITTYGALSRTLNRAAGPEEMSRGVLETLVGAMDIDAAWLYLTGGDGGLSLFSFEGAEEKVFEGARALGPYECFIGRVLSSGKGLTVKNALEDPRVTHLRVAEAGFRSLAGVPLAVRDMGGPEGRTIGVLGVASRREDHFSALDMQFLSAVGNQLGVALENARLMKQIKEKMEQIEIIHEISAVVNSSLSIGHIFRLVASEIRKMMDFDRASITLLEESRNSMRIFALDTEMPTKLKRGVRAPVEGTSASWVTRNQRPWINRDLAAEMPFPLDDVLLGEGIRSTISVPLFKDRPLGALNFDSVRPENFSRADLEVLVPVAKHLSIALENALLFEEISREKKEWEKTFDSITDMVWIEDLEGRVLRANSAVSKKTALPERTLPGRMSEDILKALRVTGSRAAEDRGASKRPYSELKGAGGSIYHHWTYPLLDSEGKTYGVVNSLKDVTEQKRLEHQLIRANKLAALGTLVAGIAHEVNNPLGIIAGYSEALLDRARDPSLSRVEAFEDFPEYLETINKEIFRCKDILKSLLDFAKPSGGTFRTIDINELIKEVILLVKHKAKKQNYSIELDLDRDIPKTAADPGALRQLFINIIMNAFYFMGEEGTLTIRTASEASEGSLDSEAVAISISDTGKGMEREILDSIFDPFFTTKPAGEGTGLGLSICHRIVSEHDGTIDIESEPGRGTTFTIRLPVRSA
ncbi:MAG: hypothetical protein Kow0025_20670 [Thermodesulfovibrionales bacterium]